MTRGVLDAAHVEVDVAPVLVRLFPDERLVVVRVHVAEVVGRRSGESGHRRQFVGAAFGRRPSLDAGQRRFALGRGAEILDGRQLQRQFVLRQRVGRVVLIVDRERLAPVALARENGVAQAVVDELFAQSALLDFGEHHLNRLLYIHAVEEIRVDYFPRFGVVRLFLDVAALDHRDDLQSEVTGEGPVARVVRRNGHDGARSVAREHVVGNVDRNGFVREGVDGVGACRNAAYALRVGDAVALRTLFGLADVLLDGGLVLGRRQFADPLVLGGDDHERHAEDRVGTGGEDLQFPVAVLDVEEDLGALRAADPVALDLLQRVAPFEFVQSVEHALGVGRHAQKPLFHALLLDRIAAADRKSVVHFVVGQHGPQLRTPVDLGVGAEGEAVVLKDLFLLPLAFGVPFGGREVHLGRAGGVQPLGAARFEGGGQFRDGARLLFRTVVPMGEHLEERPLRPLVVSGVARAHLAVPVERESDLVQLFAVAGDVLLGRDGGMLPRLDRILLGGKAEGVVTHRVEDVESLEPLVARVDVRGDVAQRMADVQARSRRVGEHVQHVEFGPRGVRLHLVGFVRPPAALPFGLDLLEIVLHMSCNFVADFPAKIEKKTYLYPGVAHVGFKLRAYG